MRYLHVLIVSLLFTCPKSYAQQELSPHFYNKITTSSLTNPAFTSSKKTEILLPSFYYSLYTPDFTLKKLFGLNDKGVRDLNEIADKVLKNRNRADIHFNTLNFGIAYNLKPQLRLQVTHSYHADAYTDIDGLLIKALMNNYEKSIGKTIPFNSIANGNVYHQLSFGGAYEYNEKLSLGIRFKILKGITSLFTHSAQTTVRIDGYNYATSYNNNIDIVTFSFDKIKELKTVNGLLKQSFNTQNMGIGFDFGVKYKLNNWQFSASMVDALSIISWNKNGKSYKGTGFHSFGGIGTVNLFQNNTTKKINIQDTLNSILGLNIINQAQYTQRLPTKTYISATYQFNDKWNFGALFYNEYGKNTIPQTDLMLNAIYKIHKNIDLGSTWGIRNKRFDNIGLQLIGQYKKVQVYGITDNIISVFNPYNNKSSSGRVGFNLIL